MASEEIHTEINELKDDLAKLRTDLGGIVHTLLEAGKAEAGEAKQTLQEKAREQIDALGPVNTILLTFKAGEIMYHA